MRKEVESAAFAMESRELAFKFKRLLHLLLHIGSHDWLPGTFSFVFKMLCSSSSCAGSQARASSFCCNWDALCIVYQCIAIGLLGWAATIFAICIGPVLYALDESTRSSHAQIACERTPRHLRVYQQEVLHVLSKMAAKPASQNSLRAGGGRGNSRTASNHEPEQSSRGFASLLNFNIISLISLISIILHYDKLHKLFQYYFTCFTCMNYFPL